MMTVNAGPGPDVAFGDPLVFLGRVEGAPQGGTRVARVAFRAVELLPDYPGPVIDALVHARIARSREAVAWVMSLWDGDELWVGGRVREVMRGDGGVLRIDAHFLSVYPPHRDPRSRRNDAEAVTPSSG